MTTRTITVTVPSWTDYELTIPEKCAECGVDFGDPANLRAIVNAYVHGGVTFDGTVLGGPGVRALGDDEITLEGPSDVLCANCGRSLQDPAPIPKVAP